MSKTTKLYILIALIIAICLTIDLVTKSVFTGVNAPFIPNIVSIFFTWNTGAGWSILANQTLLLTLISAALVIALIVFVVIKKPKSATFCVGFALVIAGAIGNLVDRVFFGAVRDFLCLEFIDFPIFNVADMCLTVGAVLLAIWLIFIFGKKEEKHG